MQDQLMNVIVSLLKSIIESKNISKLVKQRTLEKISDDWGAWPRGPLLGSATVSDVESSNMLRQQLVLRYSPRMLNASPQNEDVVSIFADMRHKSVTIAPSLKRTVAILIQYYKAHNLLYMLNVW